MESSNQEKSGRNNSRCFETKSDTTLCLGVDGINTFSMSCIHMSNSCCTAFLQVPCIHGRTWYSYPSATWQTVKDIILKCCNEYDTQQLPPSYNLASFASKVPHSGTITSLNFLLSRCWSFWRMLAVFHSFPYHLNSLSI